MPKQSVQLDYYDFQDLLSRNGVYNFIVGARGLGKTYGAKKWAIRDAIKNGNEFIYLRRYQTELKSAKPSFFADIMHEFPDHVFRVMGEHAQMKRADKADDKDVPWQTIGYFAALSKAASKKSVAYPKVTKIIFDEFIIDKGAIRYLPEEVRAFNDFFSTVDRWKDKTRVLFLANSLSIMTPYFLEYGIKPKRDQKWITSHNGFIVANFADSKDFTEGVFKTRFGKFIEGTDYSDYSVLSEFHDNNDAMIGKKTPTASYYLTLQTATGTFSVWYDHSDNIDYYIQSKRPKHEKIFTTEPSLMSEEKRLLLPSDSMLRLLRTAFSSGRATFDSPQTRNTFTDIFKR